MKLLPTNTDTAVVQQVLNDLRPPPPLYQRLHRQLKESFRSRGIEETVADEEIRGLLGMLDQVLYVNTQQGLSTKESVEKAEIWLWNYYKKQVQNCYLQTRNL